MDIGIQLTALADPTRRSIYDLIRRRPRSVRELTEELPISQPAVSQHLKVLSSASLVSATRLGTRNIYSADPDGVAVLRSWVDELWDDVLDAFTEAATQKSGKESLI